MSAFTLPLPEGSLTIEQIGILFEKGIFIPYQMPSVPGEEPGIRFRNNQIVLTSSSISGLNFKKFMAQLNSGKNKPKTQICGRIGGNSDNIQDLPPDWHVQLGLQEDSLTFSIMRWSDSTKATLSMPETYLDHLLTFLKTFLS